MPNHVTITEQGYSRLVVTQNQVSSQTAKFKEPSSWVLLKISRGRDKSTNFGKAPIFKITLNLRHITAQGYARPDLTSGRLLGQAAKFTPLLS